MWMAPAKLLAGRKTLDLAGRVASTADLAILASLAAPKCLAYSRSRYKRCEAHALQFGTLGASFAPGLGTSAFGRAAWPGRGRRPSAFRRIPGHCGRAFPGPARVRARRR